MKVLSQYNSNFSNCINDSFYWFKRVLFQKFKEKVKEFLLSDFDLKLIGISEQDNVFFSGEEYFVTRIKVDKTNEIFFRISAPLIDVFLSKTLGKSNLSFATENITELEAKILTELNNFIYQGISPFLLKDKTYNSPLAHLTFVTRLNNEECGKFILSIPIALLPEVRPMVKQQNFDLGSFPDYKTEVKIITGGSELTLFDIQHLEAGDIVVLEKSNIKTMTVELNGKKMQFKINPDTSLITGIDDDGGKSVDTNMNNNNIQTSMWDSIPVEILAEFDKVTINLGELKQISEGVIVDIANIYENKITLKVEGKPIANGELIIINDKYAVRVDEVFSEAKPQPTNQAVQQVQAETPAQPTPVAVQQVQNMPPQQTQQAQQPANGDDFNYDNFDIEDEDI